MPVHVMFTSVMPWAIFEWGPYPSNMRGYLFLGGGGNISCYTGKILALGSKSFTADDLIIQFDFSFFE
jgi:hypothetical protein